MELFISGFLLSLSLCVDIGIVNIAIIKTGIEKGIAPSFNVGLGSSFGDITYASLSLFGITAILHFLVIRWLIWIAGILVLLYLSYKMLAELFKPLVFSEDRNSIPVQDSSLKKYFVNGFILALSSPTAILWFVTVGGSIIATQTLNSKFELFYFFGGFFTASVSWSIMLSYISHKGGQLMGNRIKRYFSILSLIIFLLMAIYIFLDGYRNLIK